MYTVEKKCILNGKVHILGKILLCTLQKMNGIQLAFRHTDPILVFRPAVYLVHLQYLQQSQVL